MLAKYVIKRFPGDCIQEETGEIGHKQQRKKKAISLEEKNIIKREAMSVKVAILAKSRGPNHLPSFSLFFCNSLLFLFIPISPEATQLTPQAFDV